MNSPDLADALARARADVDLSLKALLEAEGGVPPRLAEAISHSLLGGGKRLRPILVLWTQAALASDSGDRGVASAPDVMLAACGLECLHTYSLIHDDLPAMDDDELRRGKPTCHVAFDEATAILAGDGLQALGFQWLARAGGARAGELVGKVAALVGPAGMVGGQQLDLEGEGSALNLVEIDTIDRLKTGALLAASLMTGGILAGVGADVLLRLYKAGMELGLAFQGADDLLDLHGDPAIIGKTPGKDAAQGKATWIRVEGEKAARARMVKHGQGGLAELTAILPDNEAAAHLLGLSALLWQREA